MKKRRKIGNRMSKKKGKTINKIVAVLIAMMFAISSVAFAISVIMGN